MGSTPDGVIDIYDLTTMGLAYGLTVGQSGYNSMADISPEPTYHTNDGKVDMRDIAEISRNWSKQRDYP